MTTLPAASALSVFSVAEGPWRGDFCDCACALPLLERASLLQMVCLQALREAGFAPHNQVFFQLQGGAAGIVMMAQSRLAVHAWPERRLVSLDLCLRSPGQAERLQAQLLFTTLSAYWRPARAGMPPAEATPASTAARSCAPRLARANLR